MDETRKLAQFVKETRYDDFPKEVVDKTKEVILDQLGCELASSTLPWGKATYKYVRDNKGHREESTIVNYGLRTLAQDAAFANASFGRAVEVDEVDTASSSHLGSTIIPSALAVGEKEMIGGKEFIRAVVMGYEVASRIGTATRIPRDRGLYATTLFGPFGAATAASIILGLDEGGILNAISIAATHSSGLMEYSVSGGLVNRVHGGIAAYGGIRAALLAQRGFTGPATILEGKKGFFRTFSDKASPEEVTRDSAKDFSILGVSLRRYCCCGRQNSGLDAISKIASEHAIAPKAIEAITVHAPASLVVDLGAIKDSKDIKDITDAQFSGRFGIALRLVKGGNGFKEYYTEGNLRDPEVSSLIKKIEYLVDDDLAKVPHSSLPTRVTVRLKGGTVYEETVLSPKGTIQNPMTKQERLKKFRDFASMVLPEYKVEKIIETVTGLEELDNIYRLAQLLVAE